MPTPFTRRRQDAASRAWLLPLAAADRDVPTPRARPRRTEARSGRASPRGTRTRRRLPRSAAAPRLLVWRSWRKRRTAFGQTEGPARGRPLGKIAPALRRVRDGAQGVYLAGAVPAVVAATALARLRRAVADGRERSVEGKGCRVRTPDAVGCRTLSPPGAATCVTPIP